jgi:hypothetical protein
MGGKAARALAILGIVVSATFAKADSIDLDQPNVRCDIADGACLAVLDRLQNLHWERHVVAMEVLVATARKSLATLQQEIATARVVAATERAKEDAITAATQLEARRQNSPGLIYVEAFLRRTGALAQDRCEASAFVRYFCASGRTWECGESNQPNCPSKFNCILPVKDQSICGLPELAEGVQETPQELQVTYTCNGGTRETLIISAQSQNAYFSCVVE